MLLGDTDFEEYVPEPVLTHIPTTLNPTAHASVSVPTDPVVLARILKYVRILCTRLERREGLIFEEYVPQPEGSNKKWQPAAGSVVNYGEAGRCELCNSTMMCL
jgi:hypothetical protein